MAQPLKHSRRVLGELDINKDLNTPRGASKRAPIVFGQENEQAVVEGLMRGTYNFNEVVAWTDLRTPASRADVIGLDDDDALREGVVPMDESEQEEDGEVAEVGDELDPNFDDEDFDEEMVPGLMGEEDYDEDLGEEMASEHDHGEQMESEDQIPGSVFDPAAMGLKEINNLAHFGVSSHKPGNGVQELLSSDLNKYWQSDGQQPHLLTIHFLRRVEVRAIRFYVDYNEDESYTPTNILFFAGTGHHDLIQFAEMPLANPVGWQDVPIQGCGGGPDGDSLCCWIVQMHIRENHQNGKDTHIRGIKIFALDDNVPNRGAGRCVRSTGSSAVHDMETRIDQAAAEQALGRSQGQGQGQGQDPDRTYRGFGQSDDDLQDLLESMDIGLGSSSSLRGTAGGSGDWSSIPDYMRDPEIR